MSKERELIRDMKILLECTYMGGLQRNADVLIGRAIELLTQPEQEPVAWCIESKNSADWCFATDKIGVIENAKLLDEDCDISAPFPLYLAPQKREPLSEEAVGELLMGGFSTHLMDLVRMIEKAHGIGVDDE
jgi:hypothetical protein